MKPKELRSQLRQIVKEVFPVMFTEEVKNTLMKELVPIVKSSLDQVQIQVNEATKNRLDELNKKENDLISNAGSMMEDLNVTMLSWQLLMVQKLKSQEFLGPDFKADLEEMKKSVKEELSRSKNEQ